MSNENDVTVVPDSNPGQTFINQDFDHSDLKRGDIQLAMDFFEDYADNDMKKELNAVILVHNYQIGEGMQLGNSKTFLRHVATAAKRQVADLEKVANSPGAKFYGNPAKTPEDERRIKSDGKFLLDEAIMKAKHEFITKSGRSLPGRLTK